MTRAGLKRRSGDDEVLAAMPRYTVRSSKSFPARRNRFGQIHTVKIAVHKPDAPLPDCFSDVGGPLTGKAPTGVSHGPRPSNRSY